MKKHQIADQLRYPICEYSNFALHFLEIVCNLARLRDTRINVSRNRNSWNFLIYFTYAKSDEIYNATQMPCLSKICNYVLILEYSGLIKMSNQLESMQG